MRFKVSYTIYQEVELEADNEVDAEDIANDLFSPLLDPNSACTEEIFTEKVEYKDGL